MTDDGQVTVTVDDVRDGSWFEVTLVDPLEDTVRVDADHFLVPPLTSPAAHLVFFRGPVIAGVFVAGSWKHVVRRPYVR